MSSFQLIPDYIASLPDGSDEQIATRTLYGRYLSDDYTKEQVDVLIEMDATDPKQKPPAKFVNLSIGPDGGLAPLPTWSWIAKAVAQKRYVFFVLTTGGTSQIECDVPLDDQGVAVSVSGKPAVG